PRRARLEDDGEPVSEQRFLRSTMTNRAFWFAGGDAGEFRVQRMTAPSGETLGGVARVARGESLEVPESLAARWAFRGVTSNLRYTTQAEKDVLLANAPAPGGALAALILLKKSEAWWNLAQDERRRIFEEQSRHTTIGLRHVDGISRKLHHCRDLGIEQGFDFLTWFEFEPEREAAFDALVAALRATEEWRYVEREVDVRLVRE
ncbi:MAG TPA: chlorite dismutase family protein, partial [Polyangiaceae bacterium]